MGCTVGGLPWRFHTRRRVSMLHRSQNPPSMRHRRTPSTPALGATSRWTLGWLDDSAWLWSVGLLGLVGSSRGCARPRRLLD